MTKEEFLELAAKKWDKISQNHEENESFYEYEKNFDELWIEFGRQALEGSLGEKNSDDRKKKNT